KVGVLAVEDLPPCGLTPSAGLGALPGLGPGPGAVCMVDLGDVGAMIHARYEARGRFRGCPFRRRMVPAVAAGAVLGGDALGGGHQLGGQTGEAAMPVSLATPAAIRKFGGRH